ncbi:CAP domain-containing protein [Rhodoligotrophos defluvii]|uniref:CAP domain-containing protein n=1 Tax=Rhodoligotrophos defluvii TaxID=2561934 RepID=UPI0010C9EB35|nr:CAP domain-containing protein [Rhodoligotrophos defluvii]
MSARLPRAAVLLLAFTVSLATSACTTIGIAGGYRGYAEAMLASLPQGVKLRPDLESVLAAELNAYRKAEGRAPLAASGDAVVAARAQALEMFKGDFVGHESASGYRFSQRADAFLGETASVGENTARDRLPGPVDATKARRLFRQWVDSRGHRRNMLSPDYEEVSTGVIQAGNHLYAVQILWKRRATQDGMAAFRSW